VTGFLAALAFLTRVPVRSRGSLSRAAAWFPVVGALVGGVMVGTRALAELALSPAAATVLALLAAVVVTGGLHEDGLADTADAAGAHVSRERRLEILRDPRVGTYGALAITFAVVFPVVVLAPLSAADFARAAIAGNVLGRWSPVALAAFLGPARPDGSGALLRPTLPTTAVATAIAAATALARAPRSAVAAVVATLAVGIVGLRSFGGTTGDVYGAAAKLTELAAYAAVAG
jgi:adenosylcobinamide-GDP ribazoletransferase